MIAGRAGSGAINRRAIVRCALLGLALATLAILAADWSWACLPQARLVSLRPSSSGPPGSRITVEGVGFDAPPNAIDVRWNVPDGPQLTTATGPDFSVEVTVPSVPNGLYGIVVLSRRPDGSLGNAGRAAFEVTGPGSALPPPASPPQPARSTRQSLWGASGWALFGLFTGVAAGLVVLGGAAGTVLSSRQSAKRDSG